MRENKRDELRQAADSWLDSADWNGTQDHLVESLVQFVERHMRPLEEQKRYWIRRCEDQLRRVTEKQDTAEDLRRQLQAAQTENAKLKMGRSYVSGD